MNLTTAEQHDLLDSILGATHPNTDLRAVERIVINLVGEGIIDPAVSGPRLGYWLEDR